MVPISSANTKIDRRNFLASTGAGLAALAALKMPAIGAEPAAKQKTDEQQTLSLSSGRNMSFRVLGSGEKNLILIHGFPGSSRQFLGFSDFLNKHNMCAIVPDLYGKKTDWNKRASVMDAGSDIAEVFQRVRGKEASVAVLCVSAGAKDGIATTAALNKRKDGGKVSALYVVSGQMDLGRSDTFSLLSAEKQFEFDCIRGVSKQAAIRVFQPMRNLGARVKQSVAHKRIENLCANPNAAYDRVIGAMSMSEDLPVLRDDRKFKEDIYNDIAEYSSGEIIDSIEKLFNWKIDFRALKGTKVTIIHGTKDCMVPPENAAILQGELKRAQVETTLLHYPDGHLLLKKRSQEIGNKILQEGFGASR